MTIFQKTVKSNSRPVYSNQPDVHTRLRETVLKHLESDFQCPVSDSQRQQFELAWNWQQQLDRPFIIDSGCGTGLSSFILAQKHPDKLVIGIDQSSHRLRESGQYLAQQSNLFYLQARMEEFWLLAEEADWHPVKQFLLYPNPWPKQKHLLRRWHGHPIFPIILKLCKTLELRTNWLIYAKEFNLALSLYGITGQLSEYHPRTAISRFEQKYIASQHSLFRVSTK